LIILIIIGTLQFISIKNNQNPLLIYNALIFIINSHLEKPNLDWTVKQH